MTRCLLSLLLLLTAAQALARVNGASYAEADAPTQSGDTLKLTLQQVVALAKKNSIDSRQAATIKKTKYWQYRTYRSNYQPQLSLTGDIPSYTKTFNPITQPNGTILYQQQHYDQSTLIMNFSQSIAATGGSIYGTTQMQRYDDFDANNVLYNGVPYAVGYTQPLFQYNQLKWDRRIQPLKYQESKQAYIEAQEKIALTAEGYFFDLLLAQVNLHISQTNLYNTGKLLEVANIKYTLGKVTRNEILELELEQLNARKAEGLAKRDMDIATLTLNSYIGMEWEKGLHLIAPEDMPEVDISADRILSEAYANRSDAIAFVRRVIEAKRDVALAKGQNGLIATLTANLGYSNSAQTIPDVYHNPQDQELLQLQLSIPILDWGRSKARARTAEANEELVEYTVDQDKLAFRQQIFTQVSLFNVMKEQVALTGRADSIAGAKYEIARKRYMLGDLSINDLSYSFQENDQAQRDYIGALRDFWGAYYNLRYLSLYDFESNQKINYQ
jgi:outer membrane protein TolC